MKRMHLFLLLASLGLTGCPPTTGGGSTDNDRDVVQPGHQRTRPCSTSAAGTDPPCEGPGKGTP